MCVSAVITLEYFADPVKFVECKSVQKFTDAQDCWIIYKFRIKIGSDRLFARRKSFSGNVLQISLLFPLQFWSIFCYKGQPQIIYDFRPPLTTPRRNFKQTSAEGLRQDERQQECRVTIESGSEPGYTAIISNSCAVKLFPRGGADIKVKLFWADIPPTGAIRYKGNWLKFVRYFGGISNGLVEMEFYEE